MCKLTTGKELLDIQRCLIQVKYKKRIKLYSIYIKDWIFYVSFYVNQSDQEILVTSRKLKKTVQFHKEQKKHRMQEFMADVFLFLTVEATL